MWTVGGSDGPRSLDDLGLDLISGVPSKSPTAFVYCTFLSGICNAFQIFLRGKHGTWDLYVVCRASKFVEMTLQQELQPAMDFPQTLKIFLSQMEQVLVYVLNPFSKPVVYIFVWFSEFEDVCLTFNFLSTVTSDSFTWWCSCFWAPKGRNSCFLFHNIPCIPLR